MKKITYQVQGKQTNDDYCIVCIEFDSLEIAIQQVELLVKIGYKAVIVKIERELIK